MQRAKVKSDNLMEVGIDSHQKLLEVVFRAAPHVVYTYQNVSILKFVNLVTSPSIGSFFQEEIRSRPDVHPYTKQWMEA